MFLLLSLTVIAAAVQTVTASFTVFPRQSSSVSEDATEIEGTEEMQPPVVTVVETTIETVVATGNPTEEQQLPVVTVVATTVETVVAVVATSVHTVFEPLNAMEYITKAYSPSPVPKKIRGKLATSLASTLFSVDEWWKNDPMASSDINAVVSAILQDPHKASILDQLTMGRKALTDFEKEDWYKKAVPSTVQYHVSVYQAEREAEAERCVGHPANMICEDQFTQDMEFMPDEPGPKIYAYGC